MRQLLQKIIFHARTNTSAARNYIVCISEKRSATQIGFARVVIKTQNLRLLCLTNATKRWPVTQKGELQIYLKLKFLPLFNKTGCRLMGWVLGAGASQIGASTAIKQKLLYYKARRVPRGVNWKNNISCFSKI